MTATHDSTDRGGRPHRMHHNAYVTSDLEATRHFYEDVLGLPLTATWTEVDHLPDRARVYCHCFFELEDGSALAFFQFADPSSEPAPLVQETGSIHLALSCTAETQAAIHRRLIEAGHSDRVTVRDHGYCESLYLRDPNGLRLEFTVDRPEAVLLAEQMRQTAHADLRRWLGGDHRSNNPHRSCGPTDSAPPGREESTP